MLIACGTDWYVLFVSKVYASTESDERIVLHCGWLDTIQPGEEVLFDKGASPAMRAEIEKRWGILITPAYCVEHFLTLTECASSWCSTEGRV